MTWWEENRAWMTALGIPAALSAAGRILWGRLVTMQDKRIATLEAENKALQLEVRNLLIHSSALRAKNDRLSGKDSSPPSR